MPQQPPLTTDNRRNFALHFNMFGPVAILKPYNESTIFVLFVAKVTWPSFLSVAGYKRQFLNKRVDFNVLSRPRRQILLPRWKHTTNGTEGTYNVYYGTVAILFFAMVYAREVYCGLSRHVRQYCTYCTKRGTMILIVYYNFARLFGVGIESTIWGAVDRLCFFNNGEQSVDIFVDTLISSLVFNQAQIDSAPCSPRCHLHFILGRFCITIMDVVITNTYVLLTGRTLNMYVLQEHHDDGWCWFQW